MAEVVEQASEPRPFNQWVLEQRKGALHVELSEAIAEAAVAVMDFGKPASVTLKITLKPQPKLGKNVLEVEDDVAVKVPRAPRGSALFFSDEHGALSGSNPNQPQLPLREVPRSNKEAASA